MSRKSVKFEIIWVCDICEKEEATSNHDTPHEWLDLVIGLRNDKGDCNIDWQASWQGTVCNECAAVTSYPNIRRADTAKSLLKKISEKVWGIKQEQGE